MIALLHEAHAVMCEGQSLDLHFESQRSVDLPGYYRMIECKTAQLFDASCRLGAYAAGCDEATIAGYGAVGRAYGMAFQIRDDVAGIWSTVDETGKIATSDIARRKWTFPVVWAIAQPPSAARDAVADAYALGMPLDAANVERIVAALDAARSERGGAACGRRAFGRRREPRQRRAARLLARDARPRPGALKQGSSMNANGTARATARQASIAWALPALLVAGLILRVLYIGNEGFKSDVSTYMSWALSLSERPFASFYSTVGFADYPPGYFYILAVVGHFWHAFFASRDDGFAVLRVLVKVPAILADLGIGVLLYAIVRRFASTGYALGAAALYLLNPATIYISAAWGQVDSVAGGLALLAIYALLRSSDEAPQSPGHLMWIVGAWLAFGYSLLIKPQAAVLLPLLVAFAFVDPKRRRERIVATAAGMGAALILALLVAAPFHPGNPVAILSWLWDKYLYGAGVYKYNSVNAFNLWALRGTLWLPDSQYIAILPQYGWGVLLVLAAVFLVVWRYVQDRTEQSLLEGCAVATLAFFVLATRMHERYLFNGVLFTIACLPFARRYLWGAVALSVVLLANLIYSLQYLLVVTHNVPGTNAQNLWGLGTTFFSAVVVLTFFWLGYSYLGSGEAAAVGAPPKERPRLDEAAAATTGARHWFDPTRRFGGDACTARLRYHRDLRRRKLHSVVHRLLVSDGEGLRRDLLRARRRRVSAEPADLRKHPSAADQAAHHALDRAFRRHAARPRAWAAGPASTR